ncbi:uncharacterized protein BO96DRAFT_358292 [Aspergillus niger CBS 101883]|uniref:Contig An07c0380, genomic contig n=2 Tax=Aspergillus niger TaxID=5061 RepID=A2QPP5_ASPNC|nr:uncharacterized protein BO96DRAFT_358292 [Aspergillus niger CBS 101883]XP_059603842.1 uncharacterized protein An07g10160 [Aspergillus niger]PYH60631.1 hypothetical protein BO96DRAFT_358292 [Aspergillus niger CBS 101883]CAK45145.1 unnamed protein product [Aspergillus niger]
MAMMIVWNEFSLATIGIWMMFVRALDSTQQSSSSTHFDKRREIVVDTHEFSEWIYPAVTYRLWFHGRWTASSASPWMPLCVRGLLEAPTQDGRMVHDYLGVGYAAIDDANCVATSSCT